ncbi:MAG: helix-turn-helix domain-containing protein [Lachnospiraceae bacterium]|nr:helix-turn-helix domain-containing protein [Clostridia bacterium]MBR1691203.1 helix-turn-helix domain-containing protein [Lachnospiraceae bacterium]
MDGFGDRLRKLRKEKDITQAVLAEQIGVVPSAIGKYERMPDSMPSVEALLKIAEYFNVSTDYLLTGKEPAIIENGVNGQMSNSSFIQASYGGFVINSDRISPESAELLRIYEGLGGRERLKLLNYAVSLERSKE